MDWNAIGAVGEIVGALAVVVSLLYLATQVRHSVKTTKIQIEQAELQSLDKNFDRMIANPRLGIEMNRGRDDVPNLEDEFTVQMNSAWWSWFLCASFKFKHLENDEERDDFEKLYGDFISRWYETDNPNFRDFWSHSSALLPEEFVRWVTSHDSKN